MTNFVPGGSRNVVGEAFRRKERADSMRCSRMLARADATMINNPELLFKEPFSDGEPYLNQKTGIDPGKNDDVGQAIADFDRKTNPRRHF